MTLPSWFPKLSATDVVVGGVGLTAAARSWREVLALFLWPVDALFRTAYTRNRAWVKQAATVDWKDELADAARTARLVERVDSAFASLQHAVDALPDAVARAVQPVTDRVQLVEARTERDGRTLARVGVIAEAWAEENDERRQRVRLAAERIDARAVEVAAEGSAGLGAAHSLTAGDNASRE